MEFLEEITGEKRHNSIHRIDGQLLFPDLIHRLRPVHGLVFGEHVPGVAVKIIAGIRWDQPVLGPLKEDLAELLLQVANGLAQGLARHMDVLGCSAEVLILVDLQKVLEMKECHGSASCICRYIYGFFLLIRVKNKQSTPPHRCGKCCSVYLCFHYNCGEMTRKERKVLQGATNL